MKFTVEQRERKKQAIAVLVNAGWSARDAVEVVGYKRGSAGNLAPSHSERSAAARTTRMVEMYRSGKTLAEIGVEFNVTRERIRQLISKQGISRMEGGISQKRISRQVAEQNGTNKRRNILTQKTLGCDYETAIRLNGGESFYLPKTRARQFIQQMRSAHDRNIAWELTFPEWCAIWDASGKWELRGRGRGHCCMSRRRDAGSYAVGNVQIVTNEQNISEGWDVTPYSSRVIPDETLRATQRRVFELRQDGKSHAEIGSELGISAKSSLQYCVVGKRLAQREAV